MSSTPKDQYLAVCEEIAFQRKRAEKAEAELREVTQTCADPRVNLTATLAECVRDAFAEIERLRADLAAARALLLEIRDDKDLLRHHDCMPCPGNCDACIMQMRIDALAGKDAT